MEDLGIPRSVVADLVLRYLWLHGSATLAPLNETLKLSFPVLETMFHQFRQQQLLEVKGMMGNDYSFTLTAGGRAQAAARNEVCQYVGPAPVSIQQYHKVVKSQAAHVRLSRESLRQAFDDLVLPDGLLDQLGPVADRAPVAVPLRRHRQRKDQHRGAHPADLSRHRGGAVRGGSGRPHHHAVRPGGAPATAVQRRHAGSALGGVRAAVHHGGRRAFGGHAGIAAGRVHARVHFAVPDEGQQRHSDHRRLRPPDAGAARSAESLDRAAGPARGLPDAVFGHEVPGAVRD